MIRRLIILLLIVGCGFAQNRSLIKKSTYNYTKYSIGFGLTTNRSSNVIQLTRDLISITDPYAAIYIYSGAPRIIGIGISSQYVYNESGMFYSISTGYNAEAEEHHNWTNLSIGYQIKFGHNHFFSFGLHAMTGEEAYDGRKYYFDNNSFPHPIISYDYRF